MPRPDRSYWKVSARNTFIASQLHRSASAWEATPLDLSLPAAGTVDGPAVNHQLPVDTTGPHLVLEGFHVFARHIGIVAAMKDKHLAADILGVRGRRCVQAAVETYHAGDVGVATAATCLFPRP